MYAQRYLQLILLSLFIQCCVVNVDASFFFGQLIKFSNLIINVYLC